MGESLKRKDEDPIGEDVLKKIFPPSPKDAEEKKKKKQKEKLLESEFNANNGQLVRDNAPGVRLMQRARSRSAEETLDHLEESLKRKDEDPIGGDVLKKIFPPSPKDAEE